MLLKVERFYGKDREKGWWLIDDIKKISVTGRLEFYTRKDRESLTNMGNDFVALDYQNCNCIPAEEECSNCPAINYDNYRVVRIVARNNAGDEYSILFDTVVYVLNDNGKTIEKIVANYGPK
jgi:hypothetical protein